MDIPETVHGADFSEHPTRAGAGQIVRCRFAHYILQYAGQQMTESDVELGGMPPQANPSTPAGTAPVGPSMTMTPSEVIDTFIVLDVDRNGQLTHKEFIQGLKAYGQIAQKFGLEQNVQKNVTKEKYDLIFGQIDSDSTKTISVRVNLKFRLFRRAYAAYVFDIVADLGTAQILRARQYQAGRARWSPVRKWLQGPVSEADCGASPGRKRKFIHTQAPCYEENGAGV
jgi:hypothetical protein